jgi:hypothetical protein
MGGIPGKEYPSILVVARYKSVDLPFVYALYFHRNRVVADGRSDAGKDGVLGRVQIFSGGIVAEGDDPFVPRPDEYEQARPEKIVAARMIGPIQYAGPMSDETAQVRLDPRINRVSQLRLTVELKTDLLGNGRSPPVSSDRVSGSDLV